MSPVPIVQRQRALASIGEIRLGGEKQGGKVGKKLDTFRLTTSQESLINRVAAQYGGTVEPWESPTGPAFQVTTTRVHLPVMIVVGYSLSQMYEWWEGSAKCSRRCDGEHEMLTDAPCLCNAEKGNDKCDVITRLMVVLPELGTSLGWKLRSTGEFAASELAGGMAIANEIAHGRVFVPATLRLTQRRSAGSGTVHRYVVPVLDFDPTQAAISPGAPVAGELPPAPTAALPTGHTPVADPPETGASVAEAVTGVDKQTKTQTARSSEPIPSPEDDLLGEPTPVPVPDDQPADPGTPVAPSEAVTEPASAPDSEPEAPEVPEPVPTPPDGEVTFISDAQRRRFHTIRRKHVVLEGRAKEIIKAITGQDSSAKIPTHLYDAVIAALEAEETGQDALI